MRVLFVYPGQISSEEQPLGLMYVSAVLKQHGHETRLFHLIKGEGTSFQTHFSAVEKRFVNELAVFSPQIVGFSVIVTEFEKAKILAEIVKKYSKAKIVFGGAGPTVEPERMLTESSADMVCVGEGEYAMLDVVNTLMEDGDFASIPNIWAKINGRIFRNEVRLLVEDLERLPWPDRDLIYQEFKDNKLEWVSFISARGYPYHCTYCHNPYLQEIYRGKGRYVRFRKTDNVIAEIKNLTARYKVSRLTFSDDTFTLNKQRIIEFCNVFASNIGLPFQCQTRANHLDAEVCQALKNANCEEVHIGVESGNDYISNQIWERNISRQDIISSFYHARKAGLKTASFNIIGALFETEQTIWDTIKLNRLIRPNKLIHTIFLPLSGSKAKRICQEKGWSMRPPNASYYNEIFLEQPSISPSKILYYQKMFDLYVYGNKIFYPLFHIIQVLEEHFPKGKKLYHRIYRSAVSYISSLLKKMTAKLN